MSDIKKKVHMYVCLCVGIMDFLVVPINGTASDVVGIDSATKFKNTVNDNKMVTPENV